MCPSPAFRRPSASALRRRPRSTTSPPSTRSWVGVNRARHPRDVHGRSPIMLEVLVSVVESVMCECLNATWTTRCAGVFAWPKIPMHLFVSLMRCCKDFIRCQETSKIKKARILRHWPCRENILSWTVYHPHVFSLGHAYPSSAFVLGSMEGKSKICINSWDDSTMASRNANTTPTSTGGLRLRVILYHAVVRTSHIFCCDERRRLKCSKQLEDARGIELPLVQNTVIGRSQPR